MNQIEAMELQRAATHEASHAAVIRCLGGLAEPHVFVNDQRTVEQGEKAFLGRCMVVADPWRQARWKICVGLAGIVGELLFVENIEADEIDMHLNLAIESDDLSQSDASAMSGWTNRDLERTIKILQKTEGSIQEEARRLSAPLAAEKGVL